MNGGIESLVWINDKEGHEYVCALDTDKKSFDELTDEEKRQCSNVNHIVGTERW